MFQSGFRLANAYNTVKKINTVAVPHLSDILTHLSRMEFSTIINWNSPFLF